LGFFVFARPASAWGAWGGVLLLGLALALALQLAAPTTAFMIQWPLLAGAALTAFAATGSMRLDRSATVGAAVVVGALALGQVLSWAHAVTLGIGADLPGVLTLFAFLALLFLFPLLRQASAGRLGASAVALGLGLLLVLRLHHPASPRTPHDSHVVYVADSASGRFWRADALDRVDPWSRRALEADGGRVGRTRLAAFGGDAVFAAPAKAVTVARPAVAATRLADGRVLVRAEAPAGSERLNLVLAATAPGDALTVNGRPAGATLAPRRSLTVLWVGPRAPVEVAFRPRSNGSLEVTWTTFRPAWPADARPLPPRPREVAAWSRSDSTAVSGATRLRW
jgi:hypothetical protein